MTATPPQPPSPPRQPRNSAPGEPSGGSLAGGVGLAWAIMIVGEILAVMTGNYDTLLLGAVLPPLAIVIGAFVLLGNGKSRTGKGMFLGLLSIVAVVILLVAACFGLANGISDNFH